MTPPARRAKDIFFEAIDIGPPEERAAFLDRACAGDAELRRRVEALLAAHERPESLLDRAATALGPGATVSQGAGGLRTPAEAVGAVIGPYTLLERIGDGGMGVVFRAEQAEPVRREVALKLIRPGLDTEQVLARFEAERHALELMDHPNIARVLDAGATDAGRPFFVMELVRGMPITRYCDDARLPPRQRLELFVAVCAAIQHAHQKGIIHRDIKPSNILVAEVDGRPVTKVIDFGVAKAIDQGRAEHTLLTQHGAIVGTPEYMSPEQAGAAPDVDTRTDVYSLGVLLYELLTGTTPVDRETLRRAALTEVLRQVREAEPPKPSTRLSDSGDRLPSLAAVRGTEPARLTRLVRGDLDWVVMKSLEKDRSRRYDTAAAFAADVRRHLDGDPVEASPPSRAYRLRKFSRKHRRGLAIAAAFGLLLVAATAVSTWEAARALRAERLAEKRLDQATKAQAATKAALTQSEESRKQAEAVSEFLVEAFRSPRPDEEGREVRVADVLDRAAVRLDREFAGSPATRGVLLRVLGETYHGLGLDEKAIPVLEKARGILETSLGPGHPETLANLHVLANSYRDAGQAVRAIALFESVIKLKESSFGPGDPRTLVNRHGLAQGYLAAGSTAEAIALLESTLALMEKHLGPDNRETLTCRNTLTAAYRDAGQTRRATTLLEATVKLMEVKLGPDHSETLNSRSNLASLYLNARRRDEAIPLFESTLARQEAKLGPDNPRTLVTRNGLATAYWVAGRLDLSVPMFERLLELRRAKLGRDHPSTLQAQANLGVNYRDAGRPAEGAQLMEDALRRARGRVDAEASLAWLSAELAKAYDASGQYMRSEPMYREILESDRKRYGAGDTRTLLVMVYLGQNLLDQRKWSNAEAVLRPGLEGLEKAEPEFWNTFVTRLMLGESLLGQGRYAESEPLLLSAYKGLKAREAKAPPRNRQRVHRAATRIVALYEAWGKPDEASSWRAKLGPTPIELPKDVFARP